MDLELERQLALPGVCGVLVVRGDSLTPEMLELMRQKRGTLFPLTKTEESNEGSVLPVAQYHPK